MNNPQVAGILQTIAQILEIQGENPFKVRAYSNAARTVEGMSQDLRSLIEGKSLGKLPGIGAALEQKITELVTTGKLKYFDELRKGVPAGVLEILQIPSVGPKKVKTLWQELGVTSVADLRAACLAGKLVTLKGFGERTQKKILEGIAFRSRHEGQYLLSDAMPVARRLLEHLLACKQVRRASIAGSLRRWKEVVRDVDLLAGSKQAAKVMEHFLKAEGIVEILGKGETKTSVRLDSGMQIDLRVVSDDEFPTALAYFTGSKDHNVAVRALAQKRGLKVSEYGIFRGSRRIPCKDEAEFYAALGLPYLPPEMREATGEMDLVSIPALIEPGSLRGLFHTHSTWSDGTAGIEAMAEKARSMGLRYMGLSDHSKAASYAGGLDETRLREQRREVARLNARWSDFRILHGLECDILPDGALDLTPEILGELDFVIGSVHSHFNLSRSEMTDRICRAIADPNFDILGHSTGRLLLEREGYEVDLDRVIDAAKKHGKVIELNANPHRLDLDWIHCRRAKEKGVMLSINPDAHSTAALEDVEYGIATARRGWLEARDVLNTREWDDVRAWLKKSAS